MTDSLMLPLALGAAILLLGYGLAAWALLARRRSRMLRERDAWIALLEARMRESDRYRLRVHPEPLGSSVARDELRRGGP